VLRKFCFGPGHVGDEHALNILQPPSNKFVNLPKPGLQPALVGRQQLLADAVEFPLALRQLFELEDFGPSTDIDRARELEKELAKEE